MAGLKEQFLRFYAPRDDEISSALHHGLVAVDTNVLLSLYRFQSQARDELFRVLEELGNRLWIPHQVALEFHQRRLSVIAEQERFFGKVQADLQASIEDYTQKFRAFGNRIAMPEAGVRKVLQRVQAAHQAACVEVSDAEKGNQVHLQNRDSDEILARLEGLFIDKVGDPMATAQLDEAQKEAKRRIDAKVPPGYMDRSKADPFGDYIIWKQLREEAAKRRVSTVFVTDDRKEDWFRREHGLTLGPRTQLCEEMETEAGVRLLMMTTETLLIQAKKHLGASVSSATVDQAKELPEAREKELIRERRAELSSRLLVAEEESERAAMRLHGTMVRCGEVEAEIDRLRQILDSGRVPDRVNGERLEQLLRLREILQDESQRENYEVARIREEVANLREVVTALRVRYKGG